MNASLHTTKFKRKRWLRYAIIMLTLLLTSLTVSFCTQSAPSGPITSTVPVEVKKGDLSLVVSMNGTVAFPSTSTEIFQAPGTVSEILVAEGEEVEVDQVLARLSSADISGLEFQVNNARANLSGARADLELARANVDSRMAAINSANARVDASRASLNRAQAALLEAIRNLDSDFTETAGKAFSDAADNYSDIYNKWLGIELTEQEITMGPDTLLNSWGITDLAAIFNPATPSLTDDPVTRWDEGRIYLWTQVFPGDDDILPVCETEDNLSERDLCVSREIDDAWQTYSRSSTTLAQANQELNAAQTSVSAAEVDLEAALLEVPAAEISLTSARISVDSAGLAITAAENALQEAETNLQSSELKARISGRITDLSMSIGDSVPEAGIGITIENTSVAELTGTVPQVEVALINEGDIATVSVDPFPPFEGTVTKIGVASGIDFPVTITLNPPADIQLRAGFTGSAKVVAGSFNDVLLVPVIAIQGPLNAPYVVVRESNTDSQVSVTLGESDGASVIISSGLQEGQMVLVTTVMQPMQFPGQGGAGDGRDFDEEFQQSAEQQ